MRGNSFFSYLRLSTSLEHAPRDRKTLLEWRPELRCRTTYASSSVSSLREGKCRCSFHYNREAVEEEQKGEWHQVLGDAGKWTPDDGLVDLHQRGYDLERLGTLKLQCRINNGGCMLAVIKELPFQASLICFLLTQRSVISIVWQNAHEFKMLV